MNASTLLRSFCAVAVAGAMLSACTETRFVMATAKRLGETTKTQGTYKVGKPYQVQGVWYYPNEDWSYDQTGIASWYGPNFHGKSTANGEIFDQWAVSAAHKTLPMPSLVRVTNLENGRSLVVRINDRGPYKTGRIIDLSRRAAQLLGTEAKGTARVRVQILARESQALVQRAKAGTVELASNDYPIRPDSGMPAEPIVTQSLPAPGAAPQPAPPPAPVQTQPAAQASVEAAPVTASVLPTRLYIQAGAFSDITNAERVKGRLANIGNNVSITPVLVDGQELYRVRIGPIDDVAEADRLLAQVFDAGYGGARTVVDSTAVD